MTAPVSLFAKEIVTIGGYAMAAYTAGPEHAPAVVLVHGIGTSHRYFLPFARELTGAYRVHVLELPGYGSTPKPTRALSVLELAEVVEKYLMAAHMNEAVLVGHSMGCQIIAHVARRHALAYRKLILIGPTTNQQERTRWMQSMRLLQDMIWEPVSAIALLVADYCRMGLGRYLQTSQSMVGDHIEETVMTLTLPTLFIRGEKDRVAPRGWVQDLARRIPGSELREVARAPHAVHMQQPTEVARICRAFIENNAL